MCLKQTLFPSPSLSPLSYTSLRCHVPVHRWADSPVCMVGQTDKQCCWVSFDFPHRTAFSGFSVACFKVPSQARDAIGRTLIENRCRLHSVPSTAPSEQCVTCSPSVRSERKNEDRKFKASTDYRRPVLNRNQQKRLEMVAQACNSSPWNVEAGESGVHDHQWCCEFWSIVG